MKHKAQIVEDNVNWAIVMFPLQMPKCDGCHRPLFRNANTHTNLPPDVVQMMIEAGIARHEIEIDGRHYCEDCIKAGKGEFKCTMCDRMRPLNQVVPDVGYEYNRLCTVCFESVTAAKWAAFIDKLDRSYQWD